MSALGQPGGPTRGARQAAAFLTAAGGAAAPAPDALAWFGPVGAAVGLIVGCVWWAAAEALPAVVAAGLAVGADLALTGLLHVDGLADSADGLLPPLDRRRRLAVMRQPDVGAFGVAAVVVVLGLRWSALASLDPVRPLLVGGLWALSRTTMAATVGFVPYARAGQGGLASAFRGRRPAMLGVAVGLPLSVVLLLAAWGWRGLVAGAVALVASAGVVGLGVRRVGGFTGDVLGAAGVVGEAAGLVAATVWR